MKSLTRLLGCAIVAAVAAAGPASAGMVLNYTEGGPNRGDFAHNLNWFVNKVNERSNGDIDINVNWSGALLASKDALGGLQDGVVDMGTIISQYTPAETQPLLFPELAIVRPDPWVGTMAIQDTLDNSPELKDFVENELGAVILSNFYINPSYLACAGDPVVDLETLKGAKVRGSGSAGKVMQANGANIATLSLYEAYQALASGLVDCTQTYATTTRALKFYEVADSLTAMNWGQAGAFYLMINKDVFDGLPPEQQKILLETGRELNNYAGMQTVGANKNALDEMQAGIDGDSLTLYQFDEQGREVLLASAMELADEWVEKVDAMGLPGQKILDQYLKSYAKYEGIRDSDGYPAFKQED